ncbi:hypothetical protein SADUNF_Sadunf12G0013900 [Salix dunnii]|uniref:Uncharacterized protein n=1 Tax=Salix dunnii TaxID=1413687 RepID=A0A835JMF8_9ROSI|nr:hypothetical protein SADUNF_Sadunf12G0013900 [Salix dunnii]
MPRSSRHKSSKHSSREYSDSEKDSNLKEKKAAKEESVSNNSSVRVSSEKRKFDLKENKETLNGEYVEEYSSSSKRRKERTEESNDRWNGGQEEKGEKKGKEKGGEEKLKSKRRDGSVEKKGEGRHRESSRKEDRERVREREKKGMEGSEVEEYSRGGKKVTEKTANDQLQSPESENRSDRRIRRKRDDSADGDKHRDDIGDANGKRLSSREDVKEEKPKDEKHKDGRYRDKYREVMERENRYGDDKQRDERGARDYVNNRSEEKHQKDGKDTSEARKKSKPQDRDHDREREHDRDRDRDRERDRDMDRDCDQDRDWGRNQDQDRERDRDCNLDYDGSHIDDHSARYKDNRGRKRSPEDRDDYNDDKSKGTKAPYPDVERKSLSSGRVGSDERGRSQSRQARPDNNVSSNKRRISPDTSPHESVEEYRHFKAEDLKYRDAVAEQRSKAISSREASDFSASLERTSKYRSSDKSIKMDDGHVSELSIERSSSSRASPRGLVDKSPSSSLERRFANRTGVRRSLDIEESARRRSGSISARDLPSAKERLGRDLPLEKPLADESSPADSSFYNRTNQNNSSLIPPSIFRGGGGSPSFMGSVEEDNRCNTRYKRGGDPSLGRGQGNAWRGTPNWSSPMPNGYMPFQHGPAHGGFQAMMPHFPSPPLFSARPSMEINHSGIPYHIPDADRFSGHLRPLGWHNMMDGSGPHMHGWDGNNGVFRDETHAFGQEWDQNRHQMNGKGWETNTDAWKTQNGDMNMNLLATSVKEDFPLQAPLENVLAEQAGHLMQNENIKLSVQAENVETKLTVASAKEPSKSMSKTTHEKPDPSRARSRDDSFQFARAYLSMLDISTELSSPELYSQCMSLLSMEQSANADEDIVMLVNLKDGARAVPKISDSIFSLSVLPAAKDAVFQRAMEYYKKQRVGLSGLPIVNGGKIDAISTSKMKDEPIKDVHKAEELVLNQNEEMPDVPVLSIDQKKAEEVADIHEISEELVSTPVQKEHAHACTSSQELSDQALGQQDSVEKSVEIYSGNKIDEVPSKPDNSSVVGNLPSPENAPEAEAISLAKGLDDNSLQCAGEGKGSGGTMCVPLFFSDDSPKASGALMPGSNESESVILSRIHHSPESTH